MIMNLRGTVSKKLEAPNVDATTVRAARHAISWSFNLQLRLDSAQCIDASTCLQRILLVKVT
jgi:hypothetical protein